MLSPHLFEFCDQPWVPASARQCLFELMELCLAGIRSFYNEVADATARRARECGARTVVELGAGRAPITQRLARSADAAGLTLVPCDLYPNRVAFAELQQRHPEQVQPIFEPVDMTEPRDWGPDVLLVICGSWHHIPFDKRQAVLQSLTSGGAQVAVYEPVSKGLLGLASNLLAIFPALALPLALLRRPGRLRRLLWCWLLPIVPPMFLWDSIVSWLRQWPPKQWPEELARAGVAADAVETVCRWDYLSVAWSIRGDYLPTASGLAKSPSIA